MISLKGALVFSVDMALLLNGVHLLDNMNNKKQQEYSRVNTVQYMINTPAFEWNRDGIYTFHSDSEAYYPNLRNKWFCSKYKV